MTEREVENFRGDLQNALDQIGIKYGVTLQAKTIRYNDAAINFRVEGNTVNASTGEIVIDPRKELQAHHAFSMAYQYGADLSGRPAPACDGKLPEKLLSSKVRLFNGVEGIFEDFDSRNSKYPVIVATASGQRYKVLIRGVAKFL